MWFQRQKLEYDDNDDRSDNEDEKPVVVVLKKGDLTAEEASEEDVLQKMLEGIHFLILLILQP
jgi:hypothetical protein